VTDSIVVTTARVRALLGGKLADQLGREPTPDELRGVDRALADSADGNTVAKIALGSVAGVNGSWALASINAARDEFDLPPLSADDHEALAA
jgi:hypothetical protein